MLFGAGYSQAQELSENDRRLAEANINVLLLDFSKYSSMTKTGKYIEPSYIAKFVGLFDNKLAPVYNDVDVENLTVNPIEANKYVANLIKWYSSGVSVKLEILQTIGDPVRINVDGEHYAVLMKCKKNVFGLYTKSKILNNTKELYFLVYFSKNQDAPGDFRIHSISETIPAIDTLVVEEVVETLPVKDTVVVVPDTTPKIPERKQDWAIGGLSGANFTSIEVENLARNEYWRMKNKMSSTVGIDAVFFLSQHLCMKTGVVFAIYQTSYTLSDYYADQTTQSLETDKDGDQFYRIVTADIEEDVMLRYLTIPMHLQFRLGKPGKVNFFLEPGLDFAYLSSAQVNVYGESTHQGYYPDLHVVLYDLDEYGYNTVDYSETGFQTEWDISSINFSGYMGLGVNVPIGKHFEVWLSSNYVMGFSDIGYKYSKYRDDYLQLMGDPGKTSTKCYGTLFGLRYVFNK